MIAQPDTPEMALLRRVLREELVRVAHDLAAAGPAYYTVPQAMRRFHIGRLRLQNLIDSGELTTVLRPHGKCGRPQHMILARDAEVKLARGL